MLKRKFSATRLYLLVKRIFIAFTFIFIICGIIATGFAIKQWFDIQDYANGIYIDNKKATIDIGINFGLQTLFNTYGKHTSANNLDAFCGEYKNRLNNKAILLAAYNKRSNSHSDEIPEEYLVTLKLELLSELAGLKELESVKASTSSKRSIDMKAILNRVKISKKEKLIEAIESPPSEYMLTRIKFPQKNVILSEYCSDYSDELDSLNELLKSVLAFFIIAVLSPMLLFSGIGITKISLSLFNYIFPEVESSIIEEETLKQKKINMESNQAIEMETLSVIESRQISKGKLYNIMTSANQWFIKIAVIVVVIISALQAYLNSYSNFNFPIFIGAWLGSLVTFIVLAFVIGCIPYFVLKYTLYKNNPQEKLKNARNNIFAVIALVISILSLIGSLVR